MQEQAGTCWLARTLDKGSLQKEVDVPIFRERPRCNQAREVCSIQAKSEHLPQIQPQPVLKLCCSATCCGFGRRASAPGLRLRMRRLVAVAESRGGMVLLDGRIKNQRCQRSVAGQSGYAIRRSRSQGNLAESRGTTGHLDPQTQCNVMQCLGFRMKCIRRCGTRTLALHAMCP